MRSTHCVALLAVSKEILRLATIIPIDEAGAAEQAALERLEAGDAVALPTETVYGLAADACHDAAVAKVFRLKGRPSFNPLICHVADIAMARAFGTFDDNALRLAEAFWPGPLTLVLPRRDDAERPVSPGVLAGLDTIALRQPAGLVSRLAARLGRPIAAPSANRSGGVSPTTADHVARAYPATELLVLDGGPCRIGLESTVVKVEADRLVVLRPGAIDEHMLAAATGLPVVAGGGDRIEAPGMLASHYAPGARLELAVTHCPRGAALIAFGSADGKDRSGASATRNLSETGDLDEAAARLYAAMQALDDTDPALICVEPIPDSGIGKAINDRLRRAAAPKEPA